MAVIPLVQDNTGGGRTRFTFSGLVAGDTTEILRPNNSAGVLGSIQVTGTVVGAVTLHHSNDGANWSAVKDVDGNAVSLAAVGITEFFSHCAYLEARVAAGGGASVGIIMVFCG